MHRFSFFVVVAILLAAHGSVGSGSSSDRKQQQLSGCTPPARFSVSELADELPQLLIELGTWVGNIVCFSGANLTAEAQPIATEHARFELNSTVDAERSRVVSCSRVGEHPVACRGLYPYFDGSGRYCIDEPAEDGAQQGLQLAPRYRLSQVMNRRLAIDSAWSHDTELHTAGTNYYEPNNNAISGSFSMWAPDEKNGRPAVLHCFYRLLRTCLGPGCFDVPAEEEEDHPLSA